MKSTQDAQSILQQVAQEMQREAQRQVARVVSRCLTAVFDRPYRLRILFERKRGRTEARFVYTRDGHEIDPDVTSGGVKDVVGVALRLCSLVLALPPARKLLVLDEPFRGLSKANLQKMGLLIESLSQELGVQFLVVTHDPELRVGEVVEL